MNQPLSTRALSGWVYTRRASDYTSFLSSVYCSFILLAAPPFVPCSCFSLVFGCQASVFLPEPIFGLYALFWTLASILGWDAFERFLILSVKNNKRCTM